MITGYSFKFRFDLDILQRCLLIIITFWSLGALLNYTFPICFGLWAHDSFIELWTTIAIISSVLISSIQHEVGNKSVLITGCDTGFGNKLAQHLSKLGFTVFAGCLETSSGYEFLKDFSIQFPKLHVFQMDVTKEQDWDKAIDLINNKSKGQLYGLINNAGWATYGCVEWVPMDTFRKISDINLFSGIIGIKKCLPLIRKSQGRIVNIASRLGRMGVPTRSPYVLTKYAIEGFTDCLRYEMKPFKVNVSLLEPGNFVSGTNIFNENFIENQATSMWQLMNQDIQETYGKYYFDKIKNNIINFMNAGGSDITPVIDAYTNALLDVFPQKRYQPMDFYNKIECIIATHFPEVIYELLYI